MDSRPGYGWRNRECRPCRSAPHKVEWRSGKGKRDAFYFLSSKDFLRRCGGYSFSKPYCWWMEFDFLMLCWICFTFIAVSFYLCGRRWILPVLISGYLHPCCFFFAISPFYPHLAFFFFLDYCLNYPKNTFPIIRTFTAVKASYSKTLTIASFRLGLFYLFCDMRGVHLARV